VRLDSLDYRTVEARHRNVADEIRLNRRLATNVYLGEAALVRRGDGTLALGGAGTVVDWLVKMRRLPADRMLDALIRRGALERRDIAAIMAVLMRFYEQAPVATLSAGEYRRRLGDAVGTTRDALLRPDYALPADAVELPAARQWRFLDRAAAAFDARVAHGRIVEAHGDLRPEHVCVEDEPQFIDCLEFSHDLRIQDIADELGFLALECERLGEPGLREAIFAAYADASGDAPPDALVHFHQSCRAYVRALIAIRHLDDARVRDPSRWRAQALDYLRRAREHAARCE
jgi:aminoglycoside phosphotransferase family enzyme